MTKIRQSVCRWCYEKMPLEDLAQNAAQIGLGGIDLVGPEGFATLKKHNLIGTMTPSHSIEKGLNDKANHPECLAKIRASIEVTAAAGFPNVICFSGNTASHISNEQAIENCAIAIKQVLDLLDQKNLTLHMELLNSKVNHPGYMCCRSDWGAAVAYRVNSPRFKLLYDIYHMQVEEGDVIATIRKHQDIIGHYHTGGAPGRNEIDDTQELFYPAIMRAIAETGFTGFVAHEFIPKNDPMKSLRAAAKICDV